MDKITHDVRAARWLDIIHQCQTRTDGTTAHQWLAKGTLFLFCGRRSDRIKGLLWMGDGFLLLYKRLEAGSFSWTRTTTEAAKLTEEQFNYLMLGLNPLAPKIKEVSPRKIC